MLVSALAASGCKHKHAPQLVASSNGPKDSGADDDAGSFGVDPSTLPRPSKGPGYDASAIQPGMPPPDLANSNCAVDTNKLYDLVSNMRAPEPAQLAVDVVNSRFLVAFIDKSMTCTDANYVAELEGPSGLGMPAITMVEDNCTTVDHVAATRAGDQWLLASVDVRKDERELWLRAYDGKTKFPAQRITMTPTRKGEVALAAVGGDSAVVAWVEQDLTGTSSTLYVRPVTVFGEVNGDSVTIEQSDTWSYTALSLAQVGNYMALGYRRYDAMAHSEIIMQILDATTGKPDRDAWVLTQEGGAYGSVSIAADGEGAGVMYSIVQGTSEQLWFQQLGLDGRAAPVMSGGKVGGPSDPTRVVGPPISALDASLTKVPTGFAIAYRVLPSGTVTSARIRVQFLDKVGRVIGDSDVALAQPQGGRTAMQAAYDGRVVIAWSDQTEDGKTTITAVKLPCVGGGP
jgi:hypothetical protein